MIRTRNIMDLLYAASGRGTHEALAQDHSTSQSFAHDSMKYGSLPEIEPKPIRSFFAICAGYERHINCSRQVAGSMVADPHLRPNMEICPQNSTIMIGAKECRKLVMAANPGDIDITMPDAATCWDKEMVMEKSSSDNTAHVNVHPPRTERSSGNRLHDRMRLAGSADGMHFVSDSINWQICGGRF